MEPRPCDHGLMRTVWMPGVALTVLTSTALAQPGADMPPPPPPPADGSVTGAASPGAPPATPPPPATAPPPQQPMEDQRYPMPLTPWRGVPAGVIEDANSGRGWLAPTALTPPAGTWTFSDYELFIVGASYALTDAFQVSAATLLPITSDMPFVGLFSAKARLLSAGKLHVAAAGSLFVAVDSGDSVSAGAVGGTATLCLDDGACRSHVTGYLAAGLANDDQTVIPFIASVAVAARLGDRLKIVVEANTGFLTGEVNDIASGFLGWYGLRFYSSSIGVDVGFVRPFGEDVDADLVLGLPFLSFTYRQLPEP